jgi:hypothetical protein
MKSLIRKKDQFTKKGLKHRDAAQCCAKISPVRAGCHD